MTYTLEHAKILLRGVIADRPVATLGRYWYYETDTNVLSKSDGTSWIDIVGGVGGTVVSITSDDGTVVVDLTDPANPDLSVDFASHAVTSFGKSGDVVEGDITVSEGSNITIIRSGNNFEFASTGGGGGGGGGDGDSATKIFDQILLSDTATIDTGADSIPAGFASLEVIIVSRTDETGLETTYSLTVNGDTGSNYDLQNVYGFGSSDPNSGSSSGLTSWILITHGNSGSADSPGIQRIFIPSYDQSTFRKVASSIGGHSDEDGTSTIAIATTLGWRNTDPITQLTITAPGSQKFRAGSRLIVLGIGGTPPVPVGTKLDYVEQPHDVTVTSTDPSTPTDLITGNSVSYDGTEVRFEFSSPWAEITAGDEIIFDLWDDTTRIGRLFIITCTAAIDIVSERSFYFSPDAGNHTYSIKVWKTGGTATVRSVDSGDLITSMAWIRVTKA